MRACAIHISFSFIVTPPSEIYTLSLHDALPILLKFMRASIKMIGVSNLQSFIASMTQKLTLCRLDTPIIRSEERFSRNAETDIVCRLLLEKKKSKRSRTVTTREPGSDT